MEVDEDLMAQDLFGDDNQSEAEEDDENRESNRIDEAIEAPDPTKKQSELEPLKKKIIRNPMPKLNPDRILGPRGVTILSEVFQDFTPKGGDHVFEDLDRAMKKMEHWAHRMYPKLPFDNTMARVSVLGKKMQIQTNLKKIRMGMEVTGLKDISPEIVPEEKEKEMDTTNRYDNEFPDEDMFEQIVRNAEEAEREKERSKVTLTDEQKERMMRNRELAKQRQLEKKLEKQKLADEENTLGATTSEQNQIENPTVPHSTAVLNESDKNFRKTNPLIQYDDDDESDDDPNINFVINEEPNQESEQPLSQVFESKQQKSPEKVSNLDEESNGYE